jgi:signal transduction histidine kinase
VGYWILSHHLDLAAFAVFLIAAMVIMHVWLRRVGENPGLSWKTWLGLAAIIVAGICFALQSGAAENRRLQRAISGLAPTYAHEMALGGLARINEHTSDTDPAYLRLIQQQQRWEKDNPGISDIYTMGQRADGAFYFLVDSETDYNRDGVIDEEREARTKIGEVYEEDHDLLEQALAGTPVFTPKPTTDRWGTWISTYVPVCDENGKPFAILGVDFDASEYVHSILWHRGAMLGGAGIVGLIFMGTLGMLATFRGEMAKRAALQQQLIDASRRAGMADVATGVLHNVGNVLNSVNVSASVIADKVRSPEVSELVQAAEMLRGRKDLAKYLTEDESGRHVPEYVAELAKFVNGQRQELDQEIAQLTKGIEHIKEIVRTQQQFAKQGPSSVVQEVDPKRVFQEAIGLNFSCPQSHQVEVAYDIQTRAAVFIDKHKVLQVLVNLIANAKQAMRENGGTLTLAAVEGENHRVQWRVTDTGMGISPEILPRIFQHGFTTKKDGHGFGLHSCANAAAEMHGTLKALSGGLGKGATFILEVPNGTPAEVAA